MADSTSCRAEIDRHGAELAERLLVGIDRASGQPACAESIVVGVAAHQFLWTRYMTTGALRFGEVVVRSLSAFCGSAGADHVAGIGGSDFGSDAGLGDDARFLELLTWVWRVVRRSELRRRAEAIIERTVAELRVPGLGFVASVGVTDRPNACPAGADALMLVALVEAGSVFERREWLALAREVFDEIAPERTDAGKTRHAAVHLPPRLDDRAMMSRAAMRLFEAFGKQRYLDHAVSWMSEPEFSDERDGNDAAPPSHEASLKICVLARLYALTGATRYAARAEALVEALLPVIVQSGVAGVTAIENVQTAARLLSIAVSGDPRLAETRELMRIALDCGLPDRLVLGPGAGCAPGERPLVRLRVGTRQLASIDDASRLRATLAPGGLAAAFPEIRPTAKSQLA